MSEYAIVKSNDIDNFQEIMDEILSELITSCHLEEDCNHEYEATNEKRVLDYYYGNIKDGIPDFYTVFEDVYSHNLQIFYNASIHEAIHGWDFEKLSVDDRDSLVSDLAVQLEDYHIMCEATADTPGYVEHVLMKYKLAHVFDPDDEPYCFRGIGNRTFSENKKIDIVANDCQNMIFPELTYNSCIGIDDYLGYVDIRTVKDNLRRLT